LSLFEFLKSGRIVFGGCISPVASSRPVYSIVGHWDADHVPTAIEILAPLNPPEKILKYINAPYRRFFFGEAYRVSFGKVESFTLYPLGVKDLNRIGVGKKLHDSRKTGTVPIVVGYRFKKYCGYALYIDDIDADDAEAVKKIIDYMVVKYGKYFEGVLLPAYHGTSGHKAKDPEELARISRELIEYAAQKLKFAIALAHPSIPQWVGELQKKYGNVLAFDRDLEVVCDLEEYKKEQERNKKEEN